MDPNWTRHEEFQYFEELQAEQDFACLLGTDEDWDFMNGYKIHFEKLEPIIEDIKNLYE